MTPIKAMSASDLYNQCFTLAQNGEKCYRKEEYEQAIEHFEEAIRCGTNDTGLLTAVYSQLGNAYYHLKNYVQSVEYHSHDLLLCRSMNDKVGEAFAYHNLALAWVAQHDFVKALSCVACNMKIAKETNDKTLYSQAYCAKGLVYLQKAEEDTRLCKEHVTAFPVPLRTLNISDQVQEDIYTGIESFQKYAKLVEESADNQGCGVAYANLGRAYFLLEHYALASQYYEKRLEIARGFGNKSTMRKAFTSLGNAYLFDSKFEKAIQNYQAAAQLAEEMDDKVLQAQSWYSIGNAATVGGEFELVITAYQHHFKLSRELKDSNELAKSCTALASAYKVEEDIPKALYFLVIKFKLAIELRNQEMEGKTKTSIRIAVQSDPESVIKNNRVILDPSADPDFASFSNPESPPIDMTSISFALKEDARAVSAPNLSEPLSNYILGCAKGGKPVALVLPMVDNMQVARSMPNVKADGMDFFERLERLTKQIDDQRANPAMLGSMVDQEKSRQADTLRANSASKLYDSMRRKSFVKSVKSLKNSFVKKPKKAPKDSSLPLTSTPAHKRPTSMDCSFISAIQRESFSTLNSQTSVVSTPEPSMFRVPKLPARIASSWNNIDDKENYQSNFGSSKQSSETNSIYAGGLSVDADLSFIDENDAEEELCSFKDEISGAGQKMLEPTEDGIYNPEAILDLIASIQSRRMNEQRADFLPGLKSRQTILSRFREELDNRRRMVSSQEKQVDEKLYELIMQCQSDRIEEQRSALGGPSAVEKDVTEIVMRMAAGRMEEQRAEMKSPTTKSPLNKAPPENVTNNAGDH